MAFLGASWDLGSLWQYLGVWHLPRLVIFKGVEKGLGFLVNTLSSSDFAVFQAGWKRWRSPHSRRCE